MRDVITEKFKHAGKRLVSPFTSSSSPDPSHEEFWALKDVSFEVNQGDRIGIIGRNGAGKSTLLKILSRITEPTAGQISIRGRVASLLEVGTGFHPELTGRENVFLNGAILGMSRVEIKRKFDEIVDFAEVEKFLDTPVKRYSSGMYVRLAFAVAAHLEQEILVVDEVLAVGDAEFQKKCIGKMEDVSTKEGRTILFVSHNMDAVSSLCNTGLLLEQGSIACQSKIRDVVSRYYDSVLEYQPSVANCYKRGGSGGIRITNVWVSNEFGEKTDKISSTDRVYLNLEASVEPEYQYGKKISIGFGLDTFDGQRLFTCVSSWENKEIITHGERLEVNCCLEYLPLIPGRYLVSASAILQTETLDSILHCADFQIVEEDDSSFFVHKSKGQGNLKIPFRFDCHNSINSKDNA